MKDLLEFANGITQRSDHPIRDDGDETDSSSGELAHLKTQYTELQHHFEESTNMLKNEIQHLSLEVPCVSYSPVLSQQQATLEVHHSTRF